MVDAGFYIGIVLWAPLGPLRGSMSFCFTGNTDRGSAVALSARTQLPCPQTPLPWVSGDRAGDGGCLSYYLWHLLGPQQYVTELPAELFLEVLGHHFTCCWGSR